MNEPWTPRELIESLEKWKPDEPISVRVVGVGKEVRDVILHQDTNSIHMTKERS